jgi:phage shock protein C
LISLFVMPATIIGYLVLCMLLPVRPQHLYKDERDEAFWRGVRTSPQGTFSSMRHKFREMEARLQRMERYVTSSRFNLDKEFRDLQD